MKIVVNAQFYDGRFITGIGNYCKTLIEDIGKLYGNSELTVFCRNPQFNGLSNCKLNVKRSISNQASNYMRVLWENIVLSAHVRYRRPDVFHSLNYTLPVSLPRRVKTIATVHDVSWMVYPEIISKSSFLLAKARMQYTSQKADRIIVISESTKGDLVGYFGCDPSKVVVIHLGVDLDRFNIIRDTKKLSSVKQKFNLPDSFVLWVGSIRKNKNLNRACKAFLQAKDKYQFPHSFVIAGSKSTDYDRIRPFLLQYPDEIKYIGVIDDSYLPTLYNLSSGLLFPSLYEGFGYPLVEALACGVPAITSNVSSMPEIVKDKQYLFDPLDVDSIAQKIAMLCLKSKGVVPEALRKQALLFSRQQTATNTYKLYNDLATNTGGYLYDNRDRC